jgi:RNA polymerase primary sigma factor
MKNINSKSVKITKDTSESLKLYHQEIRNINEIDKKKEIELFNQYRKTRCPKIKELLINNNLRFVINVSKYYHNGSFYELTDLISSGNIGLIKAVEEFDPSKGYKFSTYAVWWIKQSILDGIIKESKLIKQPSKLHSVNQKFLEIRNNFFNKYGFDPNVDDISEKLEEVTATEILAKSILAIDDNNIYSTDISFAKADEMKYEDILYSSLMNDEEIYRNADLSLIKLDNLNKIEKLIISYKYGFNNKPELSFSQISDVLNLNEKEIIKIHKKALKKIKNDL